LEAEVKKKVAGLPVWMWGIAGAAALYFIYRWYSSGSGSSSTAASPTATVLDPNAVDPNTGLTYGEEETAALGGGGTGGLDTFDQGIQSFMQDLLDLESLQQALQGFLPQPKPTSSGGGSTSSGGTHGGKGGKHPVHNPVHQKHHGPGSRPSSHSPGRSRSGRPQYVTVQPWPHPLSTLSGIAQHEQLPLSTILRMNPQIRNPNLVFPGQRIKV
jgi:LysM repeat protein